MNRSFLVFGKGTDQTGSFDEHLECYNGKKTKESTKPYGDCFREARAFEFLALLFGYCSATLVGFLK